MMKKLLLLLLLFTTSAFANNYPAHWWKIVPENQRQGSWEILPHECKKGEVILSKRNELGVFSNLGHSPFELDGVRYESVEGLWQGMKYPELNDVNDIRNTLTGYPYTREEVYLMHGFPSKKAGDAANKVMKVNGIDWVSYQGMKFNYKDMGAGSDLHYQIIFSAIFSKVEQNPKIKELLLKTKGLTLKPDHKMGSNKPESYKYHQILMDIRELL